MLKIASGEQAMIAAMSFVKIGDAIPPRVLAAGVPARVVRELDDKQIARKAWGTDLYVELAQRSARGVEAVAPLAAPEPGRGRTNWKF